MVIDCTFKIGCISETLKLVVYTLTVIIFLEKLFTKTHQQLPCSLKIVVNEINMYQITFLTTVLFLVKAVIDI